MPNERKIAPPWNLVVTSDEWLDLVGEIRIHRELSRLLRNRSTRVAAFELADPGSHPKPSASSASSGSCQDKLSVVVVTVMSNLENWPDFALASTHCPRRRLTQAVVLGATRPQMRKVQRMLESAVAEGVVLSPLLMLGVAAELMLDRLVGLVRKNQLTCNGMTFDLEMLMKRNLSGESTQMKIEADMVNRMLMNHAESQKIEDEILRTQRYLQRAKRRSEDFAGPVADAAAASLNDASSDSGGSTAIASTIASTTNAGGSVTTKTVNAGGSSEASGPVSQSGDARFHERFQDIFTELEDLASINKHSVEAMSQAAEHVRFPSWNKQNTKVTTYLRADDDRPPLSSGRYRREGGLSLARGTRLTTTIPPSPCS